MYFETCLGEVPDSYTAEDIRILFKFYTRGFEDGERCGVRKKQEEFRTVLGI